MNKEVIYQYVTLQDPNVRTVVLGSLLIGVTAAVVGVFMFLRKRALVGDAVAHSVLPGVTLAFILSGNKNPLILLIGAFISGWISLYAIDWIVLRTKLKADAAIGMVLSVFFGLGIVLLTRIQSSGNAAQSGLDKYLFGKAASMSTVDVTVFSITCAIVLIVVALFYYPFKVISFDRDFAQAAGFKVRWYDFLLSSITILSIATGIQAVGVVLMAALLISPAAAGRFWTDRMGTMIAIAVFIGLISSYLGGFVSYIAPSMPTGPWIVVFLSFFALMSALFAARRGIVWRALKRRRNARKRLHENLLKAIYQLMEKQQTESIQVNEINAHRDFLPQEFTNGMNDLVRKGLITRTNDQVAFTEQGNIAAKRVVRLHRLWELYLTKRLNMASDHVHHDAEAIEHVITPELERQLEMELDYPNADPHNSPIPQYS